VRQKWVGGGPGNLWDNLWCLHKKCGGKKKKRLSACNERGQEPKRGRRGGDQGRGCRNIKSVQQCQHFSDNSRKQGEGGKKKVGHKVKGGGCLRRARTFFPWAKVENG